MNSPLTILQGSALELLKTLPDESVHCCVTSPPYWGLRDYSACSCKVHVQSGKLGSIPGNSGSIAYKDPDPACLKCHGSGKIAGVAEHQLGLEKTPEEYIAKLVAIFREVRRVLRSDGTCWVNIGDSYASQPGQRVQSTEGRDDTTGWKQQTNRGSHLVGSRDVAGLKPKDMVGIPWMLAKALRDPYYTGIIKKESDRMWLAALVDGEGCFGIRRQTAKRHLDYNDSYIPYFAIKMSDRAPLDRAAEITGMGEVRSEPFRLGEDVRKVRTNRIPYVWRFDGNKAVQLAVELFPHLLIKAPQAACLYTMDLSNKEKRRGKGNVVPHSEIQLREKIVFAVQGFNQRRIFKVPDFIIDPPSLYEPGWYLRSEIIWAKKNTMPESVTDRPTKSHEQIFLLAKSSSYFYDHTAILEPCSTSTHARISQDLQNQIGTFRANGGGKTNGPLKPVYTKVNGPNSRMMRERTPEGDAGKPNPSRSAVRPKVAETGSGIKRNESWENATCMPVAARNKRDVWFIGTQPYSEAHFATFPPDLIKPCILAGTSARGCCPTCGAPWERIVEDGAPLEEWKKASGADKNGEYHGQNTKDYQRHMAQPASTVKERILKGMVEKNTVRWEPTCTCPLENPVPCTVLDPFFGSGTTGQVALEFGRHAIGLELNPEYIELCKTRCNTTQGLALA